MSNRPSPFFGAKHLNRYSTLDLSARYLTQLPERISQLTKLKALTLSDNKLAKLPESFSQLTNLKELYLDGNHLAKLPESFSQLTNLEVLILADNQLTELPECIARLINLKILALDGNQLTKLPESICKLTNLAILTLYSNHLTELPESISRLTHLQELYLGDNHLTKLSESISQLTHLKELYLDANRLTELPESISKLTNLRILSLDGNQLSKLPESISKLTKLKELYLNNNKLTELPESLRDLVTLEKLDLDENQALGLPSAVLQPTTPSKILEYYFRVQGGKRPLNEAKLILLGRGGVGKTSLVNRLVHNRFNRDENKTEGIKIIEWPLHLSDNEVVRLNIWDFGGQEIMHATHQFFLTQRSLYLLVLNGREGGEDADAEYWLKLIESFGGDSPVILVLNKIKEHAFDINRRALQQKYPSIRDFIKTDCGDGTGMEQLHKSIKRETDRLEHLRDAFPASWFTIKDRLAGMKKNYLTFEEYRKVCTKHGEENKEAQELLAGYLHNLGIALNYKDDPRLQDTHVLNPHWVTSGIYKIINAKILEDQKGMIGLSDLSEILDNRDYPSTMHRFLFDLMKRFDLCFSFPGNDGHYLIPELLDKQEPSDAAEFKPEECLNFQYYYPVLPEGLLPRFIVRTHTLSEGHPRWRTGVILKFEGNHALVKADVQDKKVLISVSGNKSGRRRLLAVIRSDFERIHCDIQNLQPHEMVPVPGYPNEIIPYKDLLVYEQQKVKHLPKVIADKVIELKVHELLNGVDLEGIRRRVTIVDEQSHAVRLFYGYSHKDEDLRDQLETHLKILQRQGLIEGWHDRKIGAGDDLEQRIDENLERADIILLLISADFIASDYCYKKEMTRALERQEKGEAQVIPVIIRDCNWKTAPFKNLNALPADGLAVTKWPDKDSAWRNVSEGIEKEVEKIHRKSGL